MKVTGGYLRGRTIISKKCLSLRPPKEFLRKGVFSTLDSLGLLEEATMLDLFCGTGAFGIEGLSRGASFCTFVDTNTELVRANIQNLDLDTKSEIITSEVETFLKKNDKIFDVIFCDPPYSLKLGMGIQDGLSKSLNKSGVVIVHRYEKNFCIPNFKCIKSKEYGGSRIYFLIKT